MKKKEAPGFDVTAIRDDQEYTITQTARAMNTLIDNAYRLLWANRLRGRKAGSRWLVEGRSINERLALRRN